MSTNERVSRWYTSENGITQPANIYSHAHTITPKTTRLPYLAPQRHECISTRFRVTHARWQATPKRNPYLPLLLGLLGVNSVRSVRQCGYIGSQEVTYQAIAKPTCTPSSTQQAMHQSLACQPACEQSMRVSVIAHALQDSAWAAGQSHGAPKGRRRKRKTKSGTDAYTLATVPRMCAGREG